MAEASAQSSESEVAKSSVDVPDPITAVSRLQHAVDDLASIAEPIGGDFRSKAADRLRAGLARLTASIRRAAFREGLQLVNAREAARAAAPAAPAREPESAAPPAEVPVPAAPPDAPPAAEEVPVPDAPDALPDPVAEAEPAPESFSGDDDAMASAIDELLAAEPEARRPVPRAAPAPPGRVTPPDGGPGDHGLGMEDMQAALDALMSGDPPEDSEADSTEAIDAASDAGAAGATFETAGDSETNGVEGLAAPVPVPAGRSDGPERSETEPAELPPASPAPTGPDAAPAPAPKGQKRASGPAMTPAELTELDRALADDIDTLIAGDLEAVGAVLDEIFDDSAIVVQQIEDDLAVMPEFCCDDGGVTEDEIEETRRAAGAADQSGADDPRGAGAVPEAGAEPQPEPRAAQAPESPETIQIEVVDAQHSQGQEAAAEPAEAPVAAEPAAAPAPPAPPAPVPAPTSEPGAVPVPESLEAEPEFEVLDSEPAVDIDIDFDLVHSDAEVPAPEREASGRPRLDLGALLARIAAPIWRLIGPPAVRVLEGANYPLRHVPESIRPVIDWLALSLLFWVPIVWFIALFVLG